MMVRFSIRLCCISLLLGLALIPLLSALRAAVLFLLLSVAYSVQGQDIKATASAVNAVTPKMLFSTPATYRGLQLLIGNGGGFTGASETYYLLDTGQLFRKSGRDTTFTALGRQTAATTKRIFAAVEKTCRIKISRFNEPGNRYQFIAWQQNGQTYRLTWGAAGAPVPATYTRTYDLFMAIVPADRTH